MSRPSWSSEVERYERAQLHLAISMFVGIVLVVVIGLAADVLAFTALDTAQLAKVIALCGVLFSGLIAIAILDWLALPRCPGCGQRIRAADIPYPPVIHIVPPNEQAYEDSMKWPVFCPRCEVVLDLRGEPGARKCYGEENAPT